MARRSTESYVSQMEKSARTFERQANRLWAQAKNNGPDEGYKFKAGKDKYEKAKRFREKAENAKKNGY